MRSLRHRTQGADDDARYRECTRFHTDLQAARHADMQQFTPGLPFEIPLIAPYDDVFFKSFVLQDHEKQC